MTEQINLFETIHTLRAMRRLKPDPVPDELINQILDAATCAPNGGNTQRWRFIVVKDPGIKKAIQLYYKRAFDEVRQPQYEARMPPPGPERDKKERQHRAVAYLTDHIHEAPVWIIPCLIESDDAEPARSHRTLGASIYPAVQNILLAARALGLGATLTTRHLFYEKETQNILGLPPNTNSYAIIPIGYPKGNFGALGRRDFREVVYLDRWGKSYETKDK